MSATAGWRPRPAVRLVAGTPAGGGQDRPARALIRALAATGADGPVLELVNMPGRGGANGWEHLARQRGDTQILGISSPPLLTNRLQGLSDVDDRDLTQLAALYTEYIAFAVRADSPLRHASDLLERLRDPAALDVALATAIGNTNHIALAQCVGHAGGDPRALRLRVFDSALDAVADVIAGSAAVGAITAVSAIPELAAGRLRVLAVSAPQRLGEALAAVPTWREQGVHCTTGTWRGVAAPPGLPAEAVAYWNEALRRAARTPEWDAELARNCWLNTYMDSAATTAYLASERQWLGARLEELGLAR